MIGTHLGEYELVARLGAGAMGAVYLGERADGSCAALKVLHPHLVEEPGYFRRFEREAAVGLSVEHENVVSVLDYEMLLVDGKPTCVVVMEYVEGRTLRALLQDLGHVPEALLREVAQQIASGLEAIHAQGVVHRDIKPDNVLITDDHRVRIMDLGVAKVLDASLELTRGGDFAGTLAYAAPEQLQGETVTPAADLYALGVLLLELATGANPFRHEDVAASISAHVNHVPRRITDTVEEVSPFLAEVVAALLEKRPEGRLGTAAELRQILSEGEETTWWRDREAPPVPVVPGRGLVPVRRETEIKGRALELAALRESWDAARRGDGRVLTVVGESGVGKSRLLDAFLESLPLDDARVLYGGFSPSGGEGALSGAVLRAFGREGLVAALASRMRDHAGLATAFAARLRPDGSVRAEEPLDGPAVVAAFGRLAQGLADEMPTIWIVEDLHFAGEEEHKAVFSVARAVADHRFLMIVTTRPDLVEDRIVSLTTMPSGRRIDLGRLSPREVIALLRDALHSKRLADRLGAQVAYKSDGVPYFVFEMLHGLRESGFLAQASDGSWSELREIEEIEVPSSVRDLLGARLRALSDDDRAILDVAAVCGYEFDPGLVADVLQSPRLTVLQRLAAMERRHDLFRGGERLVRFDHHLLREVAYAAVPITLREAYHGAIAEAMEAGHAEPGEAGGALSVSLTTNFLRGGRGDRALPHLERALEHLAARHRREEAIHLARRALAEPGLLSGRRRLDVVLARAKHLGILGRRGEQGEALAEAEALAAEVGPEASATVAILEGALQHGRGRMEEAAGHLETAVALARECGHARLHVQATYELARLLAARGRVSEARELQRRAVALAREAGEGQHEARALLALGLLHLQEGEYEPALELGRQAVARAAEAGDKRGEAYAWRLVGTIHADQNRFTEAEPWLNGALSRARKFGDLRCEVMVLRDLGRMHLWQSRYDEALEHFQRSRTLAVELDSPHEEALAVEHIGRVHASRGRQEEAAEHYERALALFERLEAGFEVCNTAALLGLTRARQGRYEESRHAAERALAVAKELGDPVSEASMWALLGDVWRRLGDTQQARRMLDASGAICDGQESFSYVMQRKGNLSTLARITYDEGDTSGAVETMGRALELAMRVSSGIHLVSAHLGMCDLLRRAGDPDRARAQLTQAAAVVPDERWGAVRPLGLALRACLGCGVVADAVRALEGDSEAPDLPYIRLLLWEATEDLSHLTAAKRLLDDLLARNPERYHAGMRTSVGAHRRILEAWEQPRAR